MFLCKNKKVRHKDLRDLSIIRGRIRRLRLAMEVERTPNSARERKLKLMGEIEGLKIIRYNEVLFRRKKIFSVEIF